MIARVSMVTWVVVWCVMHAARTHAADAPSTQAAGITAAEQEELLSVRADQGRAVVALNEAMATAQALARANGYLARWKGQNAVTPVEMPMAADIARVEKRLWELEDRYVIVRQAHFGPVGGPPSLPSVRLSTINTIRPEARKLLADAEARAQARRALIEEYAQIRRDAEGLKLNVYAALTSTREALRRIAAAPVHNATPDFAKKPPATMKPDGSTNGILIGTGNGGGWLSPSACPEIDALGFDFETAGYDYATGDDFQKSFAEKIRIAGEHGQKSTTVLAVARDRFVACPPNLRQKYLDSPKKAPDLPYLTPWAPHEKHGAYDELDFYHPDVRDMIAEYLADAGARHRDNPHILWHVTAWEPRTAIGEGVWGQWPLDVMTPAGLRAFQKHLEVKFKTIEALNKAWTTSAKVYDYKSFGDIPFPPDLASGLDPARSQLLNQLFYGRAPALHYEYQRFLKDSYADWLAFAYQHLKKSDPNHAVAVSPSHGPIDGYLAAGKDGFLWAEKACDVYASEITGPFEEMFLYSMKRLTGRATASNEYIWNGYDNMQAPDDAVNRALAGRNLWRSIALGRTALSLYGANDTYGGNAFNNWSVYATHYQILRTSAGVIDALSRRLRSMEDVWIDAPIAEPKIAMLKPSASMLCQTVWQINESTMNNLHECLYYKNYHYAMVPEEYLLDGRDSLDRYTVLLLPWATHLPPGLSEKIVAWVKNGGTLIISGVTGAFTPYGEIDGALMKEIFGVTETQPWNEDQMGCDMTWMYTAQEKREGSENLSDRAPWQIIRTPYGKGKALMVARQKELSFGGVGTPFLYEMLDAAAPRRAWHEGKRLELVLREKGDEIFLMVLNPMTTEVVRGTVHLAERYQSAVDRGIERGFAVPLRDEEQGRQVFDITLAPGEGTVIALKKQ